VRLAPSFRSSAAAVAGTGRAAPLRSRRNGLACRAEAEEPAWKQEQARQDEEIAGQVNTIAAQVEAQMKAILPDRKEKELSEAPAVVPGSQAERIGEAIQELQVGLVERDAEVRLMLLAAMAGEHILFLGPPGTAKSELGRRLSMVCQGVFFERLLTRFSVPEELFGPLSMRGLENDQYVRQIDGYLPSATVAFVDEIFKANSAILNSLLTILNERLFDNGNERFKVPLVCLVGASNELPESEELDALYDRFLLRKSVQQVSPAGLQTLFTTASSTRQGLGGQEGAKCIGGITADDFETTRT